MPLDWQVLLLQGSPALDSGVMRFGRVEIFMTIVRPEALPASCKCERKTMPGVLVSSDGFEVMTVRPSSLWTTFRWVHTVMEQSSS